MPREEFATTVDSEILANIRALAQKEGRQVDALVEEALFDLVEKHHQPEPRRHVIAAYLASHERFAALYKKLAQ
jgi:hypothetical protein